MDILYANISNEVEAVTVEEIRAQLKDRQSNKAADPAARRRSVLSLLALSHLGGATSIAHAVAGPAGSMVSAVSSLSMSEYSLGDFGCWPCVIQSR